MSHGTLPSSTDTPTDGKDEASAARKPTPEEEGYVKSFYVSGSTGAVVTIPVAILRHGAKIIRMKRRGY